MSSRPQLRIFESVIDEEERLPFLVFIPHRFRRQAALLLTHSRAFLYSPGGLARYFYPVLATRTYWMSYPVYVQERFSDCRSIHSSRR
jgi:hypothetical protein